MKPLWFVLFFVAFNPVAMAVDLPVGGTPLSIPVPDGFCVVTAEMKP